MTHWTLYLYSRRWVGILAVALGAATVIAMIVQVPSIPVVDASTEDFQAIYKWPEQERIEPRHFEAFSPIQSPSKERQTPAISFLRLAGTFMTYTQNGEQQNPTGYRIAIIDNIQSGLQRMVKQGENFEGFNILEVFETYVQLSKGEEVFEIHVSLDPRMASKKTEDTEKAPAEDDAGGFENMPALETNRFGKRIGENRWVFSRKAIMDYYEEVINDPERVVGMYKSFTTDRNQETNNPQGFLLSPVGEAAFFKDVGLQQGDVIRKVNSMNMLSQRRAEFMLAEFVRHNLNAVVIDVDREGKEEKLIYLIR